MLYQNTTIVLTAEDRIRAPFRAYEISVEMSVPLLASSVIICVAALLVWLLLSGRRLDSKQFLILINSASELVHQLVV